MKFQKLSSSSDHPPFHIQIFWSDSKQIAIEGFFGLFCGKGCIPSRTENSLTFSGFFWGYSLLKSSFSSLACQGSSSERKRSKYKLFSAKFSVNRYFQFFYATDGGRVVLEFWKWELRITESIWRICIFGGLELL